MHIHELCREIEIALQVAAVYDIDDDVRGILYQLLTDVELLWRIRREGISTGKVDEIELVAGVFRVADFGVDRDAGVVAHPLVSTRSIVEEGRLTTVGVAHQGYVDDVMGLVSFLVPNLVDISSG